MEPTAVELRAPNPSGASNTGVPPIKTLKSPAAPARSKPATPREQTARPDSRPQHSRSSDGLRPPVTERDMRSQRFNSLQPGDAVIITSNNRPGFHDVTGRRAELDNQEAVVVSTATWPNTWVTVRLRSTREVIKVRTSNMVLVSSAARTAGSPAPQPGPQRSPAGNNSDSDSDDDDDDNMDVLDDDEHVYGDEVADYDMEERVEPGKDKAKDSFSVSRYDRANDINEASIYDTAHVNRKESYRADRPPQVTLKPGATPQGAYNIPCPWANCNRVFDNPKSRSAHLSRVHQGWPKHMQVQRAPRRPRTSQSDAAPHRSDARRSDNEYVPPGDAPLADEMADAAADDDAQGSDTAFRDDDVGGSRRLCKHKGIASCTRRAREGSLYCGRHQKKSEYIHLLASIRDPSALPLFQPGGRYSRQGATKCRIFKRMSGSDSRVYRDDDLVADSEDDFDDDEPAPRRARLITIPDPAPRKAGFSEYTTRHVTHGVYPCPWKECTHTFPSNISRSVHVMRVHHGWPSVLCTLAAAAGCLEEEESARAAGPDSSSDSSWDGQSARTRPAPCSPRTSFAAAQLALPRASVPRPGWSCTVQGCGEILATLPLFGAHMRSHTAPEAIIVPAPAQAMEVM